MSHPSSATFAFETASGVDTAGGAVGGTVVPAANVGLVFALTGARPHDVPCLTTLYHTSRQGGHVAVPRECLHAYTSLCRALGQVGVRV